MRDTTYQALSATLEQRLLEVIRVGASGDAAGVRQLANRLARRVPVGIEDPRGFREGIGAALSAAAKTEKSSPLRRTEPQGVPLDRDSSLSLAVLNPSPEGKEPVLDQRLMSIIDSILEERNAVDSLDELGLEPVKTVLLSGPPGVGKTMLASFLARSLGVPLLTIDLATVMSSYLGKTGQNLRTALEFGRRQEAVVFLDEFDALGKRRDDGADVGELRRLVNILLIDLERWPAHSLLVAATNHRHLLDSAMERRFDRVVELGLPNQQARRAILRAHWPHREPLGDQLDAVADLMVGLSGSDVASVAKAAAKAVHLRSERPLEALCRELCLLRSGGTQVRDGCIRLLRSELELTHRSIAEIVGVSHPTVGMVLKGKGGDYA